MITFSCACYTASDAKALDLLRRYCAANGVRISRERQEWTSTFILEPSSLTSFYSLAVLRNHLMQLVGGDANN